MQTGQLHFKNVRRCFLFPPLFSFFLSFLFFWFFFKSALRILLMDLNFLMSQLVWREQTRIAFVNEAHGRLRNNRWEK